MILITQWCKVCPLLPFISPQQRNSWEARREKLPSLAESASLQRAHPEPLKGPTSNIKPVCRNPVSGLQLWICEKGRGREREGRREERRERGPKSIDIQETSSETKDTGSSAKVSEILDWRVRCPVLSPVLTLCPHTAWPTRRGPARPGEEVWGGCRGAQSQRLWIPFPSSRVSISFPEEAFLTVSVLRAPSFLPFSHSQQTEAIPQTTKNLPWLDPGLHPKFLWQGLEILQKEPIAKHTC